MTIYICSRCGKRIKDRDYLKFEHTNGDIEWVCRKCFNIRMNEQIKVANQEIEKVNANMEKLRQEALDDIDLQIELDKARTQDELSRQNKDESKEREGRAIQDD